MITRFATLTSRLAVCLSILFALAACGGGGGGGGGFKGDAGADEPDTLFVQVVLKDPDGNTTSRVSHSSPGTLQVLVTKNGKNGAPVADVIVNASTDSGLLFPAEGNKLTNAEGVVTFRVEASDSRGAGSIAVSVTDDNGVVITETVNFEVGATGLRLGNLVDGVFFDGEIGIDPAGSIPAKGQAILSLAIVDENGFPVLSSESIRITSNCIDTGQSTISPPNVIAVVNGQVTVTYTAVTCLGSDELTAEIVGEGAQAFGTIDVASPSANGLEFVSATPELIVLRGTGGGPDRVEKSEVLFRAVDSNNTPLEGINVNFGLTTDVGGLSLSPGSAISNAEGLVRTVVSSGDVATVVRVIASTDSGDGTGAVSTVSDVLTVSTGLPDQNSISLSVEGSFVVEEGMTKDGVTRSIIVRMSDKFNNPVPDGTAAVFRTEYGSIGSTCKTTGGTGACQVTWTSSAPRIPILEENQDMVVTINNSQCPSLNNNNGPCPDDLGMVRGGRSTILVTAIGEETFIDRNGNGIYDQEEAELGLFANVTEAIFDVNENGFYDPATTACNNNPDTTACKFGREDEFADYNSNGVFDANGDDPGNGYPDEGVEAVYNGLLCPIEGDGNWCSRELVNVRDSLVLILSADPNWAIDMYRGTTRVNNFFNISTSASANTYQAYVADLFNSKPTAGSTVNVAVTGSCQIVGKSSFTVPNTPDAGAFPIQFTVDGEGEDSGELTITLTPQNGGEPFSRSWTCIPLAPPPPDPNGLSLGT